MKVDQHNLKKLDCYYGKATDFLSCLPDAFPICYFGGNSRFEFLATAFSEVSPDVLLGKVCGPQNNFDYSELPFKTGFVGIIPYRNAENEPTSSEPQMRIYRVNESLVWDHLHQRCYRCGERTDFDSHILSEKFMNGAPLKQIEKTEARLPISLIPENDEISYLRLVENVLEDIRSGRYYQINLLRYFRVDAPISRNQLAMRIAHFGGPFSLLFQFPDYVIASLSPERFVEICPDSGGSRITTQPIKGTAGRRQDRVEDSLAATRLQESTKDNAELHIIVDLMRNDLNRICEPKSVRVSSAGKVVSYQTVHHLVAEITGRLRPRLSLGDIISNLLPGGSITGAPKVEVMRAIREYEGRPRGFFMGTGFYFDDSGHFDSSILIRTLVAESPDRFSYAAGSGIVIDSNPQSELEEIADKCRVMTESIPPA